MIFFIYHFIIKMKMNNLIYVILFMIITDAFAYNKTLIEHVGYIKISIIHSYQMPFITKCWIFTKILEFIIKLF
jgi:hypothetical protein